MDDLEEQVLTLPRLPRVIKTNTQNLSLWPVLHKNLDPYSYKLVLMSPFSLEKEISDQLNRSTWARLQSFTQWDTITGFEYSKVDQSGLRKRIAMFASCQPLRKEYRTPSLLTRSSSSNPSFNSINRINYWNSVKLRNHVSDFFHFLDLFFSADFFHKRLPFKQFPRLPPHYWH